MSLNESSGGDIMLNKDLLGANIRKCMTETGYTYEELAEFLGLRSARVIYDWVAGLKAPSTKRLYLLSKLFNRTMNDMLE